MIKQIIKVSGNANGVVYAPVELKDYKSVEGEKALSHSFVMDILRKVMGKTLTIIDASILDKQQNKAIKDLIREVMSEQMDFCADMAFDQMVLEGMLPDNIEEFGKIKSVTIEEALGVN